LVVRRSTRPRLRLVNNVLNSPEFQPFFYTSGNWAVQNYQMMRPSFGSRIHHHAPQRDAHHLSPAQTHSRRTADTVQFPPPGYALSVLCPFKRQSSASSRSTQVSSEIFSFPALPVDNALLSSRRIGLVDITPMHLDRSCSTMSFSMTKIVSTCCVTSFTVLTSSRRQED